MWANVMVKNHEITLKFNIFIILLCTQSLCCIRHQMSNHWELKPHDIHIVFVIVECFFLFKLNYEEIQYLKLAISFSKIINIFCNIFPDDHDVVYQVQLEDGNVSHFMFKKPEEPVKQKRSYKPRQDKKTTLIKSTTEPEHPVTRSIIII